MSSNVQKQGFLNVRCLEIFVTRCIGYGNRTEKANDSSIWEADGKKSDSAPSCGYNCGQKQRQQQRKSLLPAFNGDDDATYIMEMMIFILRITIIVIVRRNGNKKILLIWLRNIIYLLRLSLLDNGKQERYQQNHSSKTVKTLQNSLPVGNISAKEFPLFHLDSLLHCTVHKYSVLPLCTAIHGQINTLHC